MEHIGVEPWCAGCAGILQLLVAYT